MTGTLFTQSSLAGTIWDGGGGADTNINTAANWDGTAPGLLPDLTGGTSSIQFGISGSSNTATINTNVRLTKVTFATSNAFTVASGGGDFVLRGSNSGSTVVLQSNSGALNSIINTTLLVEAVPAAAPYGNLLTINNNRNLADTTSLRINNGISLAGSSTASTYDIRYANGSGGLGDTRIAGTISGLGTLANAGTAWTGDLVIAGPQASTVNSNISISTGPGFGNPTTAARLVLGESAADTQSWNAVALNNVMNLAIGGTITVNSLSGSGTAKITGTGAANAVLKVSSGTINSNLGMGGLGTGENAFGLTKQNAGALSIDGAKTYNGPTVVDGGTLNIASTGSLTSSITLNAGGILSGEGSTSGSLTFGTGLSTLNFDVSTATAAFTAATVATTGSPTVILTPSAVVNTGTYTVLKTTAGFGSTPISTFALATRGGSLVFSGNDLNYIAATSTPASLVWKGNDSTNPNHWDAVNSVNWVNGASPDRFYANDNVIFNDTASSFTISVQGASQAAGNIAFNNATNAYTINGAIGGAGSLTKTGAASVTLNGALTRNDAIAVSDGLLVLGSATNSITGTGGITINNGGELRFVGSTTGAVLAALGQQNVTLGGGTIAYGGTSTTTNDVQSFTINSNGSGIKVDTAANLTWRVGGAISGSGDWTKSGAGVLSLGRNADVGPGNSFTGKLTVTAGTLDIRHSDSLGTTAGSTDVQNATLLLQSFNQTAGTRSYDEPLNFSGTSYLTNLNQQAVAYTNQFTGPITVAGTLNVSTAITSGATAPVLELNGSTIVTASGSTLVLGKQGTYPVATASGNQTIRVGGAIIGPGSVIVDGSVTTGSNFILAGANTYAGPTVIGGGTLTLASTGSISGSSSIDVKAGAKLDVTAVSGFTVPNGQLLEGNGTVKGASTVQGMLAPGESAGLLTFDGSLVLSGAVTDMQVEGMGTVRGVDAGGNGYDAVDVVGSSAAITYDGVLNIDFVDGAPAAPATLDLFNFAGGPSNDFDSVNIFFAGSFQGGLSGAGTWMRSFGGTLITFTGSTGVLSLSAQAVPEPLTAAGVLVLAGRVLGRRSRASI